MSGAYPSEELKNGIERAIRLIRWPVCIRHRRAARAKRKARLSALATVRHTLQGAVGLKAGSTATVFNVGMYLLLLDQDLAYFTDDLVGAIGDRRRAFLAKHEAVLLYEAAEDLPQLLGRAFRDAVDALGASTEQRGRLNAVSSDLNQFWQRHRDFLGDIRNALAAHRDHDALRYASAVEALKPLEVMARAVELSQLLERLVGVITELASLTTGPAAILRDMIASSKKGKAG
jgi:hypothetical protein